MKKRIFSGIQPSGNLHIGNYVGAISQWIELQKTSDAIFCIVDLHAITVPQDPKILRQKSREAAAVYIACGIDSQKSHIFIQSDNPDHPYLAWLLNCITPFGQLERMTQFKDKSTKQQEGTTAGLFDHPVLMAADILLYLTNEVPVGEDQKQHIELARDLAVKFNSKYREVFTVPEPRISTDMGRIMSLADPMSKMSKSDENVNGAIFLLDTPEVARDKIMRAVTDSESEVGYGEGRAALSNLLNIYSVVSGREIEDIVDKYKGLGYGEFKRELADVVVNFLEPFQARYRELMSDPEQLDMILADGAEYARGISSQTLSQVKKAMGVEG